MKRSQLYLVLFQFIFLLMSKTAYTLKKTELETLAETKFLNQKSSFRSKTSIQNKKDPLQLMHIDKQQPVHIIKQRFMWKQPINNDPDLALNKFDYKAIQINRENIVIFEVDQNITKIEESDCNAEHYLMTIKLHNIDLPCNDNLYVCSLGELRGEYQRKLEGLSFEIDRKVVNRLTEDLAETKCLAITTGPFNSLEEVGYLCFDKEDDYILYSNLISERVFNNQNKRTYSGQVVRIDEVI